MSKELMNETLTLLGENTKSDLNESSDEYRKIEKISLEIERLIEFNLATVIARAKKDLRLFNDPETRTGLNYNLEELEDVLTNALKTVKKSYKELGI